MKPHVVVIVLCLFIQVDTFAQSLAENVEAVATQAAEMKSGNSQDVLTSFFQFALKDLIGTGHELQFQSSLLGIVAKTDPGVWVDTNYLRRNFARNLVIGVDLAIDENIRFKSNSLFLKYALVNKRDVTVFDYSEELGAYSEARVRVMGNAMTRFLESHPDAGQREAANNFFTGENPDFNSLPETFRTAFLNAMNTDTFFHGFTPEQYRDTMDLLMDVINKEIANKPLWTLSAKSTSNENKELFSQLQINTEFMKGIVKRNSAMNLEINAKAHLELNDDTSTAGKKDFDRREFSFSFGLNWIILKDSKERKSILELQAEGEGSTLIGKKYPDEKQDKLSANSILRLRITKDLWLPVEIKYEPVTGNVFGLLNLTTNFDWLNN